MTSPSTLNVSMVDEFSDRLKCVSCRLICTPPIFQCCQSHQICGNCVASVEFCPICQSSLVNENVSRADWLEKIFVAIRIACRFTPDGCKERLLTAEERSAHESNCPQGYWLCPSDGAKLVFSAVLPHLKRHHWKRKKNATWDKRSSIRTSFVQLLDKCEDLSSVPTQPQFILVANCHPTPQNPSEWRCYAYVQQVNSVETPPGSTYRYTLELNEPNGDSTEIRRNVVTLGADLLQLMTDDSQILSFDCSSLARFHHICAKVHLVTSYPHRESRRIARVCVSVQLSSDQPPTDPQHSLRFHFG